MHYIVLYVYLGGIDLRLMRTTSVDGRLQEASEVLRYKHTHNNQYNYVKVAAAVNKLTEFPCLL